MSLDLLTLGGYGQFIWPAFIFTFLSCLILYVKTKKELQKQEKTFLNEHNQALILETGTIKKREIKKEVFSGSSI
jgi:heme exporter protein D|tara:strand:- start:384 stop:608 length:225 start_codon:yes stop_codon:yes gene_type:complete